MAGLLKDSQAAPVGAASASEAVAAPAPSHAWTLGRLAVVLVAVEALTGLALMFHYRPTVATAYLDLVDLGEVSAFAFLRPLHRWAAHAVVIVVWLHLLKAVLDGSYKPPRRRNWAVGVGLLVVTLMWATTGFLLPWGNLFGRFGCAGNDYLKVV